MENVPIMAAQVPWLSVVAAALAGLLCGALGPYLVWKRLALLGDAVAHASLCVIAIALVIGLPSIWLLIPFAIGLGLLLSKSQSQRFQELDSVLGIFFAGFMGLGLLIMVLSGKSSNHIMPILFGDLQRVTGSDIAILVALNFAIHGYLYFYKRPLQMMLLQADLAIIEGIDIQKHTRALLVMISVTVAVCLHLMGVVLVTALFVAPTLSSLSIAKSVKQHMSLTLLLALMMALTGTLISKYYELPSSATIATFGLFLFLLVSLARSSKA